MSKKSMTFGGAVCVENDTLWGSCGCSSSGGYLSCSGKKATVDAGWGGFELIAPAIKATSPDPSRRASPAVLVYIIQTKKDLYLGKRTASIDRAKRIACYFRRQWLLQSTPPVIARERSDRGNLLSVGSRVYRTPMSLRDSLRGPVTGPLVYCCTNWLS